MEEKMPSLKKNLSGRVIFLLIIVITLNISIYLAINNNVMKEDEVVKFLMQDKNNLTKVLDKIDRLEDSNYQKNIDKYYDEFITNNEFFIGNKDGEKIVIEFFDYNCGYCKRSFPELMELISENKDVKVILKELPVLGESSVLASKAAIASKKQNKYFLMHQELMNLSGKISINDIKDISENIGINY
jgi:protein-disulfide isomerase